MNLVSGKCAWINGINANVRRPLEHTHGVTLVKHCTYVPGYSISVPSEIIYCFRAGVFYFWHNRINSACSQSANEGCADVVFTTSRPSYSLISSSALALSSVSQLRSDAPLWLSTPALFPSHSEAENLNLCNADLIVFQAIDYGSQVPTVHWGQCLGKEEAAGEATSLSIFWLPWLLH